MSEIRIRKRHRLREKEVRVLEDEIKQRLGIEQLFGQNVAVDRAEGPEFDVIYVNNEIIGLVYEDKAFLSVRGLLKYPASKYGITVDMGAVPFVTKGADIMGPGITDADPEIVPGDLVWIKDVKNGVPLAVGQALISGEQMSSKSPGKAIKNIHPVTDKLWKAGED